MGKFQIFRSSKNSQYYFRLKASNGEIVLSSEGYTSKKGCLNGIESVKYNSPFDQNYDRKDREKNYFFLLKANNGAVIGVSDNYTIKPARENAIEMIKYNAPNVQIEDLT